MNWEKVGSISLGVIVIIAFILLGLFTQIGGLTAISFIGVAFIYYGIKEV